MNEKMKFSVLVPVFNVEKFLAECIGSVLNQTYAEFEIILIDDGSTDSSGKICDEYKGSDSRIKAYHQTNQGHTMARRNAMAKAEGDFFLFLDSDDYWDSNLLEIISETICEFDCDLIIFKYKKVSEKRDYIADEKSSFENKKIFTEENKEQLFREIINGSNLNNIFCKAVKRDAVDRDMDYSGFKEIRNGEDLLQSLPFIYNSKKIIYIDKALYNYRIRKDSITHTYNNHLIEDAAIVRSAVLDYLIKIKADSPENLKLFYTYYIKIILNNIPKLLNSHQTKEEKVKNLNKIKKIKLYMDALRYFDINKLSLNQKILFFLFKKNHYQIMAMYVKTAELMKVMFKYFMHGRE